MALVRQEPAQHGLARARWRLVDLRQQVAWLADYSVSGISKAVRRLGLRLKRGRLRLHSPDPAYGPKLAKIARALALARAYPQRVTLLYADECSVHRQPTLADCWGVAGEEPTAPLSHRSNTQYRIGGVLDAGTGQVVAVRGAKVGVDRLCRLLRQVRAAYPDRYLVLVWDNWPVHAHPTVLAEAAAQRIRLLWLPTYAPWTNPIEKLWRWLKQTLLHHHRRADQWDELKAAIGDFLAQFAEGSPDLLRYVGLGTD